jgi:hypothetical protein
MVRSDEAVSGQSFTETGGSGSSVEQFRASPSGTTSDTRLVETPAGFSMTMGQMLADIQGLRRDLDRQEPLLRDMQEGVGQLKSDFGKLAEQVNLLPKQGVPLFRRGSDLNDPARRYFVC